MVNWDNHTINTGCSLEITCPTAPVCLVGREKRGCGFKNAGNSRVCGLNQSFVLAMGNLANPQKTTDLGQCFKIHIIRFPQTSGAPEIQSRNGYEEGLWEHCSSITQASLFKCIKTPGSDKHCIQTNNSGICVKLSLLAVRILREVGATGNIYSGWRGV